LTVLPGCAKPYDRETDRQRDRETDRETDRQRDRQTDRQTERQRDSMMHVLYIWVGVFLCRYQWRQCQCLYFVYLPAKMCLDIFDTIAQYFIHRASVYNCDDTLCQYYLLHYEIYSLLLFILLVILAACWQLAVFTYLLSL